MPIPTIQELLRPYRQDRVAEALGASPQTVAGWANGRWVPSNSYIKPLADFLRVDVDVIIDAIAAHKKQRLELDSTATTSAEQRAQAV